MCELRRQDFAERARFEKIIQELDTDKKITALYNFIRKTYPKSLTEVKGCDNSEFDYVKLSAVELKTVNDYLNDKIVKD